MTDPRQCPQCGAELSSTAPDQPCPACLMKLGLESWTEQSKDGPPTEASPGGGEAMPPEELAGKFPQFEVLKLLGRGGMGAVYQARQRSLDRLVALKIITAPDVQGESGFAERFEREAKALARLSHPNIVTIHDFGNADGLYYFVMEYVDGMNLRQLLEAGRLEPRQALEIVPAVCEALQYAHDEGIVHRDIKPENILIDSKGRVKIADFGLAKLVGQAPGDASLTATHQVMGTPRYMAPEQMVGSHDVDHRADIYSLGVVFYELLTGEVPLGRFDPPSQKVQVDVRLDEVVLRALARDPQKRYQQAGAVKTDLEIISSEAVPAAAGVAPAAGPSEDFEEPGVLQHVRPPAKWLFLTGTATVLAAVALIAYGGLTLSRIYSAPLEPRKEATSSGGGALKTTQTITKQPHALRAYRGWFWALLIHQIVALAAGVTMMTAAVCLSRLEHRRLCRAGGILALAPVSGAWPITIPIGIWTWLTLARLEVTKAFDESGDENRAPSSLLAVWKPATTVGVLISVVVLVTGLLPWTHMPGLGITLSGLENWYGIAVCVIAILAATSLVGMSLFKLRLRWSCAISIIAGAAVCGAAGYLTWKTSQPVVATTKSYSGDMELKGMADAMMDPLMKMIVELVRQEPAWGLYASICAGATLALFGVVLIFLPRDASQRTVLTPEKSSTPFAPGDGPRLLALAIGFLTSALCMAAGVALMAYGLIAYPPSHGGWGGFLGGGFGTMIGGAGGLFGCFNSYRQFKGAGDLMRDADWIWFDGLMLLYGLAGLATVGGCLIFWPSLGIGPRITFLVMGGMAALQGIGVALWRLAVRRAARRGATPPELDARLFLLAGALVICVLLIAAGVALAVVAFIGPPIGSGPFWGWTGAALGCVLGGGGALLGTWNSYRAMEGATDWMAEGRRNVFDRCVLGVAVLGMAAVLTAVIAAPWISRISVYALGAIGGMLLFQAAMFFPIRALMRRAASQDADAGDKPPR